MIKDNELKKVLERLIDNSSNIFIVGHNEPDYDSIGSAIGLQVLCTYLNRKSYIVLDDTTLESGIKRIVDDNRDNSSIINKEECLNIINNNSSLIMTDVNPDYLISLKSDLDKFKNIIIIDHHKESIDTVKTNYKYIDIKKSSACEIVTNLLSTYKYINITPKIANYLYSGIVLDTQRFKKNITIETMNAAKYLIKNGAQNDIVNDLFLSKFEDDKKINNLVFSNTIFRTFNYLNPSCKKIAFVLNRKKPNTIYTRVELAKAADKLLKYKIDASFAIGYIKENLLSVSARSKGDIDVADILSNLENIKGGGNTISAGAKAKDLTPIDFEKIIVDKILESLMETHDNPHVLKNNKKN